MSEQKFLPFALPDIGEEEINEVVDALRSGWVTTGPKTRQFEADFAAYLAAGKPGLAEGEGKLEAISVNSATEPGQPCVMISGSAFGSFERTWRKWMSSPSIPVVNWSKRLSFASRARQS